MTRIEIHALTVLLWLALDLLVWRSPLEPRSEYLIFGLSVVAIAVTLAQLADAWRHR